MKEVAKLEKKDRTELFQATAISMGMQPNVIEKDFWVCFMLDHLFHDCRYKGAFVFKGGTSLSKSYHVIERFSEDIDLILDVDGRCGGYNLQWAWSSGFIAGCSAAIKTE